MTCKKSSTVKGFWWCVFDLFTTVSIGVAPPQASLMQPLTTYQFHYLVKRCLKFSIYAQWLVLPWNSLCRLFFLWIISFFLRLFNIPFFPPPKQDAMLERWVLTGLPFRPHLNTPLQTFRAANVDMFESSISLSHRGCKCKHNVN